MNPKYDLDVMLNMYGLSINGIYDATKWGAKAVYAWHITPSDNVPDIKTDGLHAKPCKGSQYATDRPSAVYLFASKSDAFDTCLRDHLFGDTDKLSVVKVRIPATHFQYLREDGLFNISFFASDRSMPFGVQYQDDIPADWILSTT